MFAKWGLLGAATYPLFKYGKIIGRQGRNQDQGLPTRPPPLIPEPRRRN